MLADAISLMFAEPPPAPDGPEPRDWDDAGPELPPADPGDDFPFAVAVG
jgi:hypothetical protein